MITEEELDKIGFLKYGEEEDDVYFKIVFMNILVGYTLRNFWRGIKYSICRTIKIIWKIYILN